MFRIAASHCADRCELPQPGRTKREVGQVRPFWEVREVGTIRQVGAVGAIRTVRTVQSIREVETVLQQLESFAGVQPVLGGIGRARGRGLGRFCER